MRKKILIILTFIAGLATVASGYQWYFGSDKQQTTNPPSLGASFGRAGNKQKNQPAANENNLPIFSAQGGSALGGQSSNLPNSTNHQSPITNSTTSTSQSTPIAHIILQINNSTLTIPYADQMTAEDAMNEAMKKYPDKFSYHGTNYGAGLGTFIEEINGVKNSTKEKMYWILYINNKKSNRGISSLILNTNDIIKWNYEKEIL